ncbi:PRTRC system ThiF family protein [Undibacterium arcticum]
MGIHMIHPRLLQQKVRVAVIGAGGTGSQVLNGLVRLHLALLAFGHPGGLDVTLWDDDQVSEANVGRQSFFPGDVGAYKAPTLINRINLGFNLDWSSQVERLTTDEQLHCEIVVGCVDNRKARSAILSSAQRGRVIYWLDCGNRLDDSQVILGEVDPNRARQSNLTRLPHAADLFPNLINASLDAEDGVPSCSLADALEKQSLFINSTTALHACNILSQLFRHGQIANHGSFVNLKTGRTAPLMVDEEAWKRFGYGVSKSRKKKKEK